MSHEAWFNWSMNHRRNNFKTIATFPLKKSTGNCLYHTTISKTQLKNYDIYEHYYLWMISQICISMKHRGLRSEVHLPMYITLVYSSSEFLLKVIFYWKIYIFSKRKFSATTLPQLIYLLSHVVAYTEFISQHLITIINI